ncbi:MAG: phosphoribosylanthranilate isomerase [Chitinophagaceae bacterium]|nr:phosphoribosylanthranilate isomerase [Chitinophagaceae bacterium]MDB5221458.1 phosphoribosylanthranilate isomerase [Chitinophagaceae bacterium]
MQDKRVKVKICCISSISEAKMAMHYGASAIGLVARMPSGPGPIDDELIKTIAGTIPPPVATFLLTCETSAEQIISHHKRTFTNTIQLVDALPVKDYAIIKEAIPAIKLVQVIHVIDEGSVEEAIKISEYADTILLDSGNPKLAIKELGGTGRVHNWKLSRKIKESINIPLFLAGGLNAANVRQAIDRVEPFGVDVCSGVRTNGQLDENKLKSFFEAVKNL